MLEKSMNAVFLFWLLTTLAIFLLIATFSKLFLPFVIWPFVVSTTIAGAILFATIPSIANASQLVFAITGALGGAFGYRAGALFSVISQFDSAEVVTRCEYERIWRQHLSYVLASILIATFLGTLIGLGIHFALTRSSRGQ